MEAIKGIQELLRSFLCMDEFHAVILLCMVAFVVVCFSLFVAFYALKVGVQK